MISGTPKRCCIGKRGIVHSRSLHWPHYDLMTGYADGFQRPQDQNADVGCEFHHDVGIDVQSGFRHDRDVGKYDVWFWSRVQRQTLDYATTQIVQVDFSINVPRCGDRRVQRVTCQIRPVIGHRMVVPIIEVEDSPSTKGSG